MRLWNQCGLIRPWNDPAQDISRAMAGPSSTILVGEKDGRLVASAMIGHDGHRGWVYYLAVAEEHRRSGLGAAILDAAAEWLKSTGAIKVMLMVRRGNVEALKFYEKAGFVESEVLALEKWLTRDGRRPG